MAKIKLDKYYTSPELAKYCVEKTKEIIGGDNITEYIEPSAGAGVFLDYLDKPYLAYDIEPEDKRVVKQDWLTVVLEYKKGRCVIGNPPFGKRNNLAVAFYKKSINLCDFISFILPISQYNNNQQMYEFDLVYSENLGLQKYIDRDIKCCLNIYRRNNNGGFNKKIKYSLKDVEIKENRRGSKQIENIDYFDIGICSYGNTIVGRIPEYQGQYVKEMYFKIHNVKYKKEILDIIKNTNWHEWVVKGSVSGQGQFNICQWMIYKYLKEQIPELE